ncbi:MAG: reverse transcriptase domain-containing protein [Actinomycetota bacterium]|nr:reverse transcriptase domain-containing protein [Actinomycetota bacterium]
MEAREVRELLDSLDQYPGVSGTVISQIRDALDRATVGTAAAIGAELGRTIRRLPDHRYSAELSELRNLARASLDRAMTERDGADDDTRTRTLADEIVNEVRAAPLPPTRIAENLGVHVSQISRAGRLLQEAGRLKVVPGSVDRRQRLYELVGVPRSERGLAQLVAPVLPDLSFESMLSDLVPDRLGDRFGWSDQRRVLAAVKDEIESGEYEPCKMHIVRVAKQGGGTRPAAAPAFADRAVFAALVERCRGPIASVLNQDASVLWPTGYRSEKKWSALEHFAVSSRLPYLVSVDVQGFYATVRHSVLADRLLSAGCDPQVVGTLIDLLGRMSGRSEGVPQGLEPSDPLAGIMLAPIDRALHENSVAFVRHGDDLRIAVPSVSVADEVVALVRDRLELLELQLNEEKTRTLRHQNYVDTRTKVRSAVDDFVAARGSPETGRIVQQLLAALDVDEDLQWGWYHGTLEISDVLELSRAVDPEDKQAVLVLVDAVLNEQRRLSASSWAASDSGARLLTRTTLQLMTGLQIAPPNSLSIELLANAEYDDVLPAYISAIAPVDPEGTAALLREIQEMSDQDGLWLRVYQGIDGANTELFDEIAGHHSRDAKDAAVRVRAARFLARRHVDRSSVDWADEIPLPLRADALSATTDFDPDAETRTTRALLAVGQT